MSAADDLARVFRRFLADLVHWALRGPAKPGHCTIHSKGMTAMADRWQLDFDFPPIDTTNPANSNSDVVTRRLSIVTDGGATVLQERDYPADATVTDPVQADEGAVLVLTLVDIDNADNQSPPSVTTVTVVDDIPPSQPGQFAVHSKTSIP